MVMDYFFKLVTLSGRFITKSTQSIIQAYNYSKLLAIELHRKYENALCMTGDFENVLEMYNSNLEDMGCDVQKNLVFVSDGHKEVFEKYLSNISENQNIVKEIPKNPLPELSKSEISLAKSKKMEELKVSKSKKELIQVMKKYILKRINASSDIDFLNETIERNKSNIGELKKNKPAVINWEKHFRKVYEIEDFYTDLETPLNKLYFLPEKENQEYINLIKNQERMKQDIQSEVIMAGKVIIENNSHFGKFEDKLLATQISHKMNELKNEIILLKQYFKISSSRFLAVENNLRHTNIRSKILSIENDIDTAKRFLSITSKVFNQFESKIFSCMDNSIKPNDKEISKIINNNEKFVNKIEKNSQISLIKQKTKSQNLKSINYIKEKILNQPKMAVEQKPLRFNKTENLVDPKTEEWFNKVDKKIKTYKIKIDNSLINNEINKTKFENDEISKILTINLECFNDFEDKLKGNIKKLLTMQKQELSECKEFETNKEDSFNPSKLNKKLDISSYSKSSKIGNQNEKKPLIFPKEESKILLREPKLSEIVQKVDVSINTDTTKINNKLNTLCSEKGSLKIKTNDIPFVNKGIEKTMLGIDNDQISKVLTKNRECFNEFEDKLKGRIKTSGTKQKTEPEDWKMFENNKDKSNNPSNLNRIQNIYRRTKIKKIGNKKEQTSYLFLENKDIKYVDIENNIKSWLNEQIFSDAMKEGIEISKLSIRNDKLFNKIDKKLKTLRSNQKSSKNTIYDNPLVNSQIKETELKNDQTSKILLINMEYFNKFEDKLKRNIKTLVTKYKLKQKDCKDFKKNEVDSYGNKIFQKKVDIKNEPKSSKIKMTEERKEMTKLLNKIEEWFNETEQKVIANPENLNIKQNPNSSNTVQNYLDLIPKKINEIMKENEIISRLLSVNEKRFNETEKKVEKLIISEQTSELSASQEDLMFNECRSYDEHFFKSLQKTNEKASRENYIYEVEFKKVMRNLTHRLLDNPVGNEIKEGDIFPIFIIDHREINHQGNIIELNKKVFEEHENNLKVVKIIQSKKENLGTKKSKEGSIAISSPIKPSISKSGNRSMSSFNENDILVKTTSNHQGFCRFHERTNNIDCFQTNKTEINKINTFKSAKLIKCMEDKAKLSRQILKTNTVLKLVNDKNEFKKPLMPLGILSDLKEKEKNDNKMEKESDSDKTFLQANKLKNLNCSEIKEPKSVYIIGNILNKKPLNNILLNKNESSKSLIFKKSKTQIEKDSSAKDNATSYLRQLNKTSSTDDKRFLIYQKAFDDLERKLFMKECSSLENILINELEAYAMEKSHINSLEKESQKSAKDSINSDKKKQEYESKIQLNINNFCNKKDNEVSTVLPFKEDNQPVLNKNVHNLVQPKNNNTNEDFQSNDSGLLNDAHGSINSSTDSNTKAKLENSNDQLKSVQPDNDDSWKLYQAAREKFEDNLKTSNKKIEIKEETISMNDNYLFMKDYPSFIVINQNMTKKDGNEGIQEEFIKVPKLTDLKNLSIKSYSVTEDKGNKVKQTHVCTSKQLLQKNYHASPVIHNKLPKNVKTDDPLQATKNSLWSFERILQTRPKYLLSRNNLSQNNLQSNKNIRNEANNIKKIQEKPVTVTYLFKDKNLRK